MTNDAKMGNEFFEALEALEKDKGIPKEYMLEKVEAALLTAYKKESNNQNNVRISLDPVKRTVRMYVQRTVCDPVEDERTEISLEEARTHSKRAQVGDVIEYEIKPKNFGRISAGTAKMVIIQGIREAERGMMMKEYESKREEVVTATVSLVDPVTGNAVLEIGSHQTTLVKSEQLPTDHFRVGDLVKVYVCSVKSETRGPRVILSRTHPGLVKRLFETEVPEIQDGTVVIHSVARDPGNRTKIAVYSNDPEVDPIGACIGVRGMRKSAIMEELAGEKIDIVKYSEDPAEFIEAALSPAEVVSVTVNDDRTSRVIVRPDQLSLAIGKKGQNAFLAHKLTGYKIDIKSTDYTGE